MRNFVPTWHQLRMVGRSSVARLTVLMPVIGYILLFGETTSEALRVGTSFFFDQEEASVAREWSNFNLYCLYIGLIVFSICTIFYNIFCPDLIKTFENKYQFLDMESAISTRNRIVEKQSLLREKFGITVEGEFEEDANGVDERVRTLGLRGNQHSWFKANSIYVLNILNCEYDARDKSGLWFRLALFVFYIISLVIVAIPTIRTIIKVIF